MNQDPSLADDRQILRAQLSRRRLLAAAMGAGALAAAGCTGETLQNPDGSCNGIPMETAGPFPANGSSGQNALALEGIVRRDIRASFAGATGTAAGLAVTLRFVIVDDTCAARVGYAVYAWHADQDGGYSMYTVPEANYLRGVQVSDDEGVAAFTTVFPGCYPGRWPHVHFDVYQSVESAIGGDAPIITSQLAFAEDTCNDVYASAGYGPSAANLADLAIERDGVFADGFGLQMARATGSVVDGLTLTLDVALMPEN